MECRLMALRYIREHWIPQVGDSTFDSHGEWEMPEHSVCFHGKRVAAVLEEEEFQQLMVRRLGKMVENGLMLDPKSNLHFSLVARLVSKEAFQREVMSIRSEDQLQVWSHLVDAKRHLETLEFQARYRHKPSVPVADVAPYKGVGWGGNIADAEGVTDSLSDSEPETKES